MLIAKLYFCESCQAPVMPGLKASCTGQLTEHSREVAGKYKDSLAMLEYFS